MLCRLRESTAGEEHVASPGFVVGREALYLRAVLPEMAAIRSRRVSPSVDGGHRGYCAARSAVEPPRLSGWIIAGCRQCGGAIMPDDDDRRCLMCGRPYEAAVRRNPSAAQLMKMTKATREIDLLIERDTKEARDRSTLPSFRVR